MIDFVPFDNVSQFSGDPPASIKIGILILFFYNLSIVTKYAWMYFKTYVGKQLSHRHVYIQKFTGFVHIGCSL